MLLLIFILALASQLFGRAVIVLIVVVSSTFICTRVVRCAALVFAPRCASLLLLIVAHRLVDVVWDAWDHR